MKAGKEGTESELSHTGGFMGGRYDVIARRLDGAERRP